MGTISVYSLLLLWLFGRMRSKTEALSTEEVGGVPLAGWYSLRSVPYPQVGRDCVEMP